MQKELLDWTGIYKIKKKYQIESLLREPQKKVGKGMDI